MAYVFIQVRKRFHNNALNDHNFGYMTKGWCPLTSSVIPSLQSWLRFHRAAWGQRFCGFRSQSLNSKGYFCLLGQRNQDNNSSWGWYLKGAIKQPNHILGLSQQNYRSAKGDYWRLTQLSRIKLHLTLEAHWDLKIPISIWERKWPEKARTGPFNPKWL